MSRGVRLGPLCWNNKQLLTWVKKRKKIPKQINKQKANWVTQMSPLMIMSWYSPGKDTLTQAHIVSLDPCRIRSCLEQSWLRLGTQPELLQHVSGEREREPTDLTDGKNTQGPPPYKHTQFKAFAWCTHFALAFPACQWRCTEKSAFTTSGDYTHYCQLFQQLGYILWLGKHLEVLLLTFSHLQD